MKALSVVITVLTALIWFQTETPEIGIMYLFFIPMYMTAFGKKKQNDDSAHSVDEE